MCRSYIQGKSSTEALVKPGLKIKCVEGLSDALTVKMSIPYKDSLMQGPESLAQSDRDQAVDSLQTEPSSFKQRHAAVYDT